MAIFVEAQTDAADLASLVNENGLFTTRYGDNPKKSWLYMQDEFDTLLAGFTNDGNDAIDDLNVFIDAAKVDIASDVTEVDNARVSAIANISNDLNAFDAYYQSAKDSLDDDVAAFTIDSDAALADFAQNSADAFNEFDLTLDQYKESRGFNNKGTFAAGFTYELPNDVGIDESGNPWIYNGALPFAVVAGTTPTSPTYTQVTYGVASQVSMNTSDTVQSFADSFALKVFQSPTGSGLTEIQTRTVSGGEVYEVRKTSDDSLANIYSDATGTTEITQDGTSNVSGSDGVVEFYIDDGDYYVSVGVNTARFETLSNLQETTSKVNSALNSELVKGDILKKVQDKTHIRGMYIRKVNDTDLRVGLGMGGVSDAVVEYRFFKNTDGLLLVRGGYSGREDPTLYLDDSAVLTGAFNEGSAPETYTLIVGDKVNGGFTGNCFTFISRVDNRGGLWNLTLTDKYGNVKTASISTFNATTVSYHEKNVFTDLAYGDYTYELEFMGEDPNNTPSSTARGWIYYRPDQDQYPVRFLTVAPLIEANKQDILSANSIPDFAIKARKAPNTSDTEWVPQHGSVSGVTTAQIIKIIADGVVISSTNDIPDIDYQVISSFQLLQGFDAINPIEPTEVMWEHVVTHSISMENPYISISNRIEFVQDTYCAQIYFAMLPSDTDHAERLVFSGGAEIDSIPNDGSEINFNQENASAMYAGLYSASITHAAICRVNGLKDSLNWGTEYQEDNSGRTTFRADSITKCYWNAGAGVTVPAGAVMKSNHDLMVVTGIRSPDALLKSI